MIKKTPLNNEHHALQAKMVSFAGWEMPISYHSQIEEHHCVRQKAGMFDVSHMNVIDLSGNQTQEFLRYLLAGDVGKLTTKGRALYSCMLTHNGGVIDDLIVYYRAYDRFRLVLNASTYEKDLAWINNHAEQFKVNIKPRADLAMIAVQGPKARELVHQVLDHEIAEQCKTLKAFQFVEAHDYFVACTGYTGEDGYEIIFPAKESKKLWDSLLKLGVTPCGLGARDTLRLEAGFNLYGNEMTEETSPLETGLGWTIAWDPQDRQFIGRQALEQQQQQGIKQKLVGLVLQERGVMRSHSKIMIPEIGEGEVTSGTFSPSLGVSIAMAKVPVETGPTCLVDVRGKWLTAQVVKPAFVRRGKKLVEVK